jgi:hypothetical protein
MAPVPTRNPRFPTLCSALALGLALVLTLGLTGCSGGGSKTRATPTTTGPRVLAVKTSVLKVGSVDVESAGPPNVEIDTATGRAVLGAAQAYIDNALFSPLRTGKLGARYGALFDAGVRPAATGADEAALTDLDVGTATSLSTRATPVRLSALVGTLGELMYVATDFQLTLKATGAAGPLTITHIVELTFAQPPAAKTWLVTAYRVTTVRRSTAATTTTAATGGTTP